MDQQQPAEDDEDLAQSPLFYQEPSREELLAEAARYVDPGAKYRASAAAVLKPKATPFFGESLARGLEAYNEGANKEAELIAKYVPIVQTAALNRQRAALLQSKAQREQMAGWNATLDNTASTLLLDPNLSPQSVGAAVQQLVTQGRVPGQLAQNFLKSLPEDPVALRETLTRQAIARTDPTRAVKTPTVEKYSEGEVGYAVNPVTGERTKVAEGAPKQSDVARLMREMMALEPGDPAIDTYRAAINKAITHAPNQSTIIMPEKKLMDSFVIELGKSAGADRDSAKGAKSSYDTANSLLRVLDDPVVSGPSANAEIVLRRMAEWGGYGGKTNRERLVNTSQAVQAMAQLELDAAAQLKGQGAITDAERALLRRAASGDITMSVPEMRVLAGVAKRVAARRIRRYNDYAKRLTRLEGMEKVAPLLEVEFDDDDPASTAPEVRFDSDGRPIKK